MNMPTLKTVIDALTEDPFSDNQLKAAYKVGPCIQIENKKIQKIYDW